MSIGQTSDGVFLMGQFWNEHFSEKRYEERFSKLNHQFFCCKNSPFISKNHHRGQTTDCVVLGGIIDLHPGFIDLHINV